MGTCDEAPLFSNELTVEGKLNPTKISERLQEKMKLDVVVSEVRSVTIERKKDLVTVKGTMDVKVLVESLNGRMKIVKKKKKKKGDICD
ncbi:hypothetical protein SAY87_015618 [Trapa incisa]|uniref:HMA domain-containing protein n=1 Tax=Trapa incisa TaxID=236973 RepID=A0AAN7LFF1_9MYRT|nr:hypothetical protein SAY87_015618 [Trapa incisa]